jgi:uncharacterized protein YkwD
VVRRPRRAAIAVVLVSAATAMLFAPSALACKGTSLRPTHANLARVTAATLCLIEQERLTYRVEPLRSNSSLRRIGTKQAGEMVIGEYFGDDSLSGWTPMQRIEASAYAARARGLSAGQNIGWGSGALATPAAMVHAWMLSPPHREIMLSGGYRNIGIGIAPAAPQRSTEGLQGATYAVEFASRD